MHKFFHLGIVHIKITVPVWKCTRAETIDPDVIFGPVNSHIACGVNNSSLLGTIGYGGWRGDTFINFRVAGYNTVHAADIDNGAFADLSHVRYSLLGGNGVRACIAKCCPEVFQRGLIKFAVGVDYSTVDENIKPAAVGGSPINTFANGLLIIYYVAFNTYNIKVVTFKFINRLFENFFVVINNDDLRSCLSKGLSEIGSQPAGTSRNGGDFPCKVKQFFYVWVYE